jgi:hypothetical protein
MVDFRPAARVAAELMKKGPRTVWIGIGITMVLIVVGLLLATYRQQKELELLRAELKLKGEKLDFRDLIPTVPEGKSNGEMELQAALNLIGSVPGIVTDAFVRPGVAIPMSRVGVFPTEFAEYKGSVRTEYWVSNQWEHAEQFVESFRTDWALVSRAATNDIIVRRLDWMKGPKMGSADLVSLRRLIYWCHIAVTCELRARNFESAIRILTEMLTVLGIQNEPLSLSQVIRQASFSMLAQGVWEVLQYAEWHDAQLGFLQDAIEGIQLSEPALEVAQMNRAHMVATWEQWTRHPAEAVISGVFTKSSPNWWDGLMVRAWSLGPAYGELAWYLRKNQRHLEAARAAVRAKSVDVLTRLTDAIPYSHASRLFFLTGFEPTPDRQIRRTMKGETIRSVLLTAVALKRFSLTHRDYPESLVELVPRYLSEVPVDWMDGQPIRYKRVSHDKFTLWSIGKDGDDGGDPTPAKPRHRYYWTYGRDWVWPSCATEEEIRKFEEEQLIKWRMAK